MFLVLGQKVSIVLLPVEAIYIKKILLGELIPLILKNLKLTLII